VRRAVRRALPSTFAALIEKVNYKPEFDVKKYEKKMASWIIFIIFVSVNQ
jgi:hypothetical protein